MEEMRNAGVTHAVQISTEKDDMEWSESFALSHENIWYTLGIHPESEFGDDKITFLEMMAARGTDPERKRKLLGIGEIGLDYYWNSENKAEQIDFFEKQIAVAAKYSLPIIVHSRDAFDDMYAVLKKAKLEKGILHCFSGNAAQAKLFLDLGYYISFAGNVTYRKASNLHESAAYVPADRLFLETDCPYLSPQPVRGTKNHPAFVTYTYEHVASLRGADVEDMTRQISDNFFRFIGQ
jgi:TatD DNase family protein